MPEGGQWVGWGGAVCGPGVGGHSREPRAEATRQHQDPSSHPPHHLTIGPRAPPEVQACDLGTSPLREAPDPLCPLSPSCLQAGSPFCVPCDLRAVCGLPSDRQGQSVHGALGSSGVRTEGASGTRIPLNQAQVRTVATPRMQPPDCAGRGRFLLH